MQHKNQDMCVVNLNLYTAAMSSQVIFNGKEVTDFNSACRVKILFAINQAQKRKHKTHKNDFPLLGVNACKYTHNDF